MRGFMTLRDDFFAVPHAALSYGSARSATRGMPVDIIEAGNSYELHADFAGFAKEDISIEIDGDVVSLSASKPQASEAPASQERTVLRSERYTGKLERRFKLGAEVDEAGASAKFENGILLLTLPKKAVETRRVTIQ